MTNNLFRVKFKFHFICKDIQLDRNRDHAVTKQNELNQALTCFASKARDRKYGLEGHAKGNPHDTRHAVRFLSSHRKRFGVLQ